MNRLVIVLLLLGALPLACSKKQAAEPQPASAPPTNAVAETAPATPATPAPEAAQPVVGTVDPGMTEQLRAFMQKNGRLPNDFAELARMQLDSRPRPPKGMKWDIDRATAEVKLVKQ